MDQLALADSLVHPSEFEYREIPCHHSFMCHDFNLSRTIKIWCHPTLDNVYYYLSDAFNNSHGLSIFFIIDDLLYFRHGVDFERNNKFRIDSVKVGNDNSLIGELHRARLSYLLDCKLEE